MYLSVTNTWTFDSLFQILLAAATDNEKIEAFTETKRNDNVILNMVYDAIKNGICPKTYHLRAKALIHILGVDLGSKCKLANISCAMNIGYLTKKIF